MSKGYMSCCKFSKIFVVLNDFAFVLCDNGFVLEYGFVALFSLLVRINVWEDRWGQEAYSYDYLFTWSKCVLLPFILHDSYHQ